MLRVSDLLNNIIEPFGIKDEKLIELFSFYLHLAPTINSRLSIDINNENLMKAWAEFIKYFESGKNKYAIISSSTDIFNSIKRCKINEEDMINRKNNVFVCKKKSTDESNINYLLRHMRNSIAHGNVYLKNQGNRKYILFEDYNIKGNLTARIIFSQTNLYKLKKIIDKKQQF